MRMRTGTMLKSLVILMVLFVMAGKAPAAEAPPNEPADVKWDADKGQLSIKYNGEVIFEATVVAEDKNGEKTEAEIRFKQMKWEEKPGDKVEQGLTFSIFKPPKGVVGLVLRGTVTGSEEAFPSETRSAAQDRFPYVRNSVGLSRNLRNNAVYDRHWDWVLIGPADGKTRITPDEVKKKGITFSWESRSIPSTASSLHWETGGQKGQMVLELTFRPRFYQKHKGLMYFEPWTYKVWKESVSGYCTWWSYKRGMSQQILDAVLDVFKEKNLPDYGYRYVQFDDAYQSGSGSPEGWLKWNSKFPGGPEYAVKKIKEAGMEPGVWVFCIFKRSDPIVQEMAEKHPEWFIHNADGEMYTNHGWYALDTTNKDALERMVRPAYRGLKKLGFTYVKIDAAGDLVDWGYRKCPAYLEKTGTEQEALRRFYVAAREELGRDIYVLTCWGVLEEQIGVADGCRLSTDGFRAASFQGFNSWEGVVWRNDPDHCDVLPVGREKYSVMKTFGAEAAPLDSILRPSVTSLAGGVLLLSDKVEVYKDDNNLEGAKRSAPVLFTVPGQLYDYTPKYQGWHFRNHARSGGGEARWWFSEIDRPFDHWSVLCSFNWRKKELKWERAPIPATEVKFADLGLPADREHLVFEFWNQKFIGKVKGSFTVPAQDVNLGAQLFVIREARPHPWVLSTTRHISQGAVSLLDVKWDDDKNVLSGKSAVVVKDPYVLTIHLPRGFKLESAEIGGEKAKVEDKKETVAVSIVPSASKTVDWKMTFAK